MHICFLSSMHSVFDKRVFGKEAVCLAEHGHRVVHLCPGESFKSFEEQKVKIVTYRKPNGLLGRLANLRKIYIYAKSIDADVYHCNEVDSWIIGVLLKIVEKKKCVFDVHEHYPSTFSESRFPQWLQPVIAGGIRTLFRLLTPFTDRLVLAKKSVSEDFICSESKKVLVRNFAFSYGVTIAEERRQPTENDIVTIVHLGLISKARGWPQMLEALKIMRNKNVRLRIIGEFNDGTHEEFERMVREYKLENFVVVHDWLPFEKAFEYLMQAHIGLVVFQPGILNHVYAMPHKMFDYMAAGMAVICPHFAVEIAPIVQETCCGRLVDPSRPEQLASTLDELVSNLDNTYEMGKKGQHAVKDQYNWEVEVEHLLRMYKEWDHKE